MATPAPLNDWQAGVVINSARDFSTAMFLAFRDPHLTQTAIAEKSGVSTQTIGAILHRRRSPSIYTALALLDALGFEMIIRRKDGND